MRTVLAILPMKMSILLETWSHFHGSPMHATASVLLVKHQSRKFLFEALFAAFRPLLFGDLTVKNHRLSLTGIKLCPVHGQNESDDSLLKEMRSSIGGRRGKKRKASSARDTKRPRNSNNDND